MLVALDAGASDVVLDGSAWKITCEPNAVDALRDALEAAGLAVESAEATMVSSTVIEIGSADEARKVLKVIDGLEEHDDVQDVYANFDISEDILSSLEQ
jgi:transcriptional/translational regulatory protein YebC/TACO1